MAESASEVCVTGILSSLATREVDQLNIVVENYNYQRPRRLSSYIARHGTLKSVTLYHRLRNEYAVVWQYSA